jgi:hypothetical protein
MPTMQKFNDFSEQMAKGVHHFGTDTFKLVLTNSAPAAANTMLSDVTVVSSADYSSIATQALNVAALESESAGTTTITGDKVTWTAATAALGPFQYYVLYNDSATSPLDALVGYWNHGSAVTLQIGETFSVRFGAADNDGTIFTMS